MRQSVLYLLAASSLAIGGSCQQDAPLPDPGSEPAPPATSPETPPQQEIPVADIACTCDPILLAQRGFSCNGMCGNDCASFYKNTMGLAQVPECSWSRVSPRWMRARVATRADDDPQDGQRGTLELGIRLTKRQCEAQVRVGRMGTYVGKCTCVCSPAAGQR